MTNSNSLLGQVGNSNYDLSEFESTTAYQFSQFLENQENGLYDDYAIPTNSSIADDSISNYAIFTDSTTTVDVGEDTFEVQNLGIFNGSSSIDLTDDIDGDGDIYQFSIDQSNDFAITLDGLSADADLYVLDSMGEVVGLSENPSSEAESLSGSLDAGTYFLEVASYDGMDTDYSLSILTGDFASGTETDPTVAPDPIASEDPGETLDLALDFGAFDDTGMLTYSESVGDSDPTDFYQFSISQSNDFNFVLEGISADADLSLIDSNGEVIAVSENYDTDVEILTGSLPADTYFLKINSFDSIDTDYNLHAIAGENALSLAEINEIAPGLATEFASI